jgi:hypothetical protein
MITLEGNRLVFRFPDVHADATCAINFQRTLRIPDDGQDYFLPPGLGTFPLRHLDDFKTRVPEKWLTRGGVVMPMHQAEAMWINFGGSDYPFAVKIAAGKINAVTGETWINHLNDNPQDYVVLPEQPWLDGYCVEKGTIRQFVAMPLGQGYSAEEQITGTGEHGGLQILVYPMKAARYEELVKARDKARDEMFAGLFEEEFNRAYCLRETTTRVDMGLAPGGRMRQAIYDDPYGLDAWDQRHFSRCFVTIANSSAWMEITGERPPTQPPTAKQYTAAGLPWFDYYDADAKALEGAEQLKRLKSVAAKNQEKGAAPLTDNDSVQTDHVIRLRKAVGGQVREMAG